MDKIILKKIANTLFGNKLLKNKLPGGNDVKKILVISLYFTGDLLFHTPVIEALKKIYPDSKVDIWIKSRTGEIIEYNPSVAGIFIYDNLKTSTYREKTRLDIKGKINFLKKLRYEKYDIIFDFTGKYSTALFTLLARPKYSVGLNYNYFGFCYDKFIPLYTATESGHLIDKYLSIVKQGLSLNESQWGDLKEKIASKPYIYVADKDKLIVDELLKDKFGKMDTPYVVLHLTSGWSAKELPLVTFAGVFKHLAISNIKYLIVGDNNDQNRILEVSNIIKDETIKPEKYFVKLKLSQSAELIRRAKLFIGSDSAPLQMAGAFNVPSIGLFGPTNPEFSNPIGGNNKVIYHQLHCSASEERQYCTRNGGFSCPFYECMHTITSSEIISLINELYPGN